MNEVTPLTHLASWHRGDAFDVCVVRPRSADPWTVPMDGAEATRRRQRIPSSRDELVKERRSRSPAPQPFGRGRHQVPPSARRGLYAPPDPVSNQFNALSCPPGKRPLTDHNALMFSRFLPPPMPHQRNGPVPSHP
jgi:hypothetical protein